MRTEQEVRELYRQYIYRWALADLDKQKDQKQLFSGASIALGRTLRKDGLKIDRDFKVAKEFIMRLRSEGKELPGFREV